MVCPGQRRGANGSGNPSANDWTQITATTRHGFTGHEHLDNLSLIHMNGRVYDPYLGRFLSADPFIDGADTTQGYNRFSYVANNPLSFTDPSGFCLLLVNVINGCNSGRPIEDSIPIETVMVHGRRIIDPPLFLPPAICPHCR